MSSEDADRLGVRKNPSTSQSNARGERLEKENPKTKSGKEISSKNEGPDEGKFARAPTEWTQIAVPESKRGNTDQEGLVES